MTHADSGEDRAPFKRSVHATRVLVSALGVLFAISGMNHGLFEVMQGNVRTGGWFIHSIGARQQMWAYGTEDAFTVIPNFLVTGLAAITVSLLIVVWSLKYIDKMHGSTVFLLLFILLLLVGGGVAQVVFFTLAWAVATRIHKPVKWLKAALPANLRGPLAEAWPWLLGGFTVLALAALEMAITGYAPGVTGPMRVLHTCWTLLAVGLGLLLLAILSAFVHDADEAGSASHS